MPSFNSTHPELQPGEQFYINIEADKAEKVMLHQPVNNPEYDWRLGTKAYTYSGIPIPQRLPLFRKLKEQPQSEADPK